jgi:uncharacterized C2H2 Zn-finger protein
MPETYKCPDCNKTFSTRQAIGPHRQKAHGYRKLDGRNDPSRVQGKKPRWPLKREPRVGSFPCPSCDFVAKWPGGLKHHILSKHSAPAPSQIVLKGRKPIAQTTEDAAQKLHAANGHFEDRGQHRLEAAATFACGRITQLLESVAIQYDVPPRTFATLVLRTLGRTP